MNTDRIEKKIVLRAPRSRVWQAITDKREFGAWFRCRFDRDGQFQPGQKAVGNITHPGYEHLKMEIDVVDVVPEKKLSFRWHPYAIDTNVDYSAETPTLVTFTLADADGGTLLTIVESGFDKIPAHRRDEAFRMNESGWTAQLKNIENHVAATR